jgi:hypothetical protein
VYHGADQGRLRSWLSTRTWLENHPVGNTSRQFLISTYDAADLVNDKYEVLPKVPRAYV